MPIFPISFSMPPEKIVAAVPPKTRMLAHIIPGDLSTYIYKTEEEYYKGYQDSYFGITGKKGGWDCMRHYEILANGCIPLFCNIWDIPKKTMANFPRELITKTNELLGVPKIYRTHTLSPSVPHNSSFEKPEMIASYLAKLNSL